MKELFAPQSFSEIEIEEALRVAVDAAEETAGTLKDNHGTAQFDIKHDDEHDWVTYWDQWAEEVIKARLATFSSQVGFCGEETGITGSEDVYWTIDPIDGTSHFVRGSDFCTTMISLVDHGSPVAAVIHDFTRGDTYTAIAGGGAFKNFSQALHVSTRPIETSYPELYTDEEMPEGQRLRTDIEKTGAYLLRTAAAGFTLTSVARGLTEGFVSVDNPYGSEWDIAPGALLIHEAGGIVRNVGTEGFTSKKFDIVAANPVVFTKLAALAMKQRV
jgi:myo-inositol-1(or 4)-monophosphatase